jgi:hypothetical protein
MNAHTHKLTYNVTHAHAHARTHVPPGAGHPHANLQQHPHTIRTRPAAAPRGGRPRETSRCACAVARGPGLPPPAPPRRGGPLSLRRGVLRERGAGRRGAAALRAGRSREPTSRPAPGLPPSRRPSGSASSRGLRFRQRSAARTVTAAGQGMARQDSHGAAGQAHPSAAGPFNPHAPRPRHGGRQKGLSRAHPCSAHPHVTTAPWPTRLGAAVKSSVPRKCGAGGGKLRLKDCDAGWGTRRGGGGVDKVAGGVGGMRKGFETTVARGAERVREMGGGRGSEVRMGTPRLPIPPARPDPGPT